MKIRTALKIMIFSLGLFFVLPINASAEVIKNFDSQIGVNPDSSISVTETIVYDSEGLEKHGIFRDITPKSSTSKSLNIKDISITDNSGNPYQWQREINNGDIRLKIGDPNTTFEGEKTYVIQYTVTNAISYFDNYDEVYWNATGNNWPFSIQSASASVILPESQTSLQQSCYVGPKGTTESCNSDNGVFKTQKTLSAGEGLTIAVGFPKGVVTEYLPTLKDKALALFGKFWPVLIPLIVFIYMFQKWYKKGRDPKGKGTIIPQYEVLDNLTPLEASVIINQKFGGKDLIAEILYLATQGYLTIEQTEKKKFLGKKVDYNLTIKKLPDPTLKDFDEQLLKEIFPKMTVGEVLTLSQSYSLFGITHSLENKIKSKLVEYGYYTKDFLSKSFEGKIYDLKNYRNITIIFILVVLVGIGSFDKLMRFLISALIIQGPVTILLLIASVILTAIIVQFFKIIMPAKTQKGIAAKEHFLGLREYINIAEKDRIAFHNAPEANAALFEKLLPYAIMFGLEKKWAKAFEGLTLPPPLWYSSNNGIFMPTLFVSDFSDNFASSFFNVPASSTVGSGGGGFSGGGGGGGGGGSW